MAWKSNTLCDRGTEVIHTPEGTLDLVGVTVIGHTVSELEESSGRRLRIAIHFSCKW